MHDIFNLMRALNLSNRNRRLMSRIALNALGHANVFPVDVSELRELSADNRALVRSFLCWAEANRDFIKDLSAWGQITSWATGHWRHPMS